LIIRALELKGKADKLSAQADRLHELARELRERRVSESSTSAEAIAAEDA
jgi:hypothetical protein